MHPQLTAITQRIIERSRETRRNYLDGVAAAHDDGGWNFIDIVFGS